MTITEANLDALAKAREYAAKMQTSAGSHGLDDIDQLALDRASNEGMVVRDGAFA